MGYRETLDRILHNNFKDATTEQRESAAKDVIMVCSLASGGLVLQPIPGLGYAVIPVQIAMVGGVAHIFGEELSRKQAREVLLDIGAITGVNMLGRQALTALAKVVLPGIGGALAAPSAFAITWSTGHAAVHYFRSGGKPDRDRLKAIFEREKQRGREHYSDAKARDARPSKDDLEA